MNDLETIQKMVKESQDLVKAPPGPPPRLGLVWSEEHHRWVKPEHIGHSRQTS